MSPRPSTVRRSAALLAVALALGGCSGDDDTDAIEPTTTPGARAPATSDVEPIETTDPAVVATSDAPPTTAPPSASVTAPPVSQIPETGIPGLDSDDAFCAAWSRFGGSWQVIQVAANFTEDRALVRSMEVVASPVVDAAYDEMFAAWPAELADERDIVAESFFGVFERRSQAALDALVEAGATPDELDAIGDDWLVALATRVPDDPVVLPVVAPELQPLVDAAVDGFADQRVDYIDDPSLIVTAATPLTDAFLRTGCPDQGTLSGQEVDAEG